MEWQEACALDELEDGVPTLIRVGTGHVLLIRQQDTVQGMEPLCPHKFTPLVEGDVQGHCIHCPTHDAAFDTSTGAPRAGDEWAGRLQIYPCKVDGGRVWVGI